jgi:hypothetical protein
MALIHASTRMASGLSSGLEDEPPHLIAACDPLKSFVDTLSIQRRSAYE